MIEQLSLLTRVIIDSIGTTCFYEHGYLYRIIYHYGTNLWMDSDGVAHKDNGPAWIYRINNGDLVEHYYTHGVCKGIFINGVKQ